jgi:hypothetical protein
VHSARLFGDTRSITLSEHEYAHSLAEAVGQQGGTSQLLLRMARIEAGTDVQFDRFVELCERRFFGQFQCLFRRVRRVLVDEGCCC